MVVPKEIIEDICKNTYGISLQTASCSEIIENHILPIYQEGAWKSKVNQLLGYICYIKDNLSQYEKESNEKNNSDSLSSLKASLLIKTDENRYLRPADVYLPASYGNPNDLEILLSGIQDVWFVSSEYIQDLMQIQDPIEKAEKIREWRDFFIKLGIHTVPKVDVEVRTTSHKSNKKYIYTHEYPIYRSSHILKIFEINDIEKNKRLAKILDSNWNHYKEYKQWCHYIFVGTDVSWCVDWRRASWAVEADWFTYIKTAAWLPTTKGKLANPSEVLLAEPETVSILGDSISYLDITLNNLDFIKDLGIKNNITDPKYSAD
ncbi:hypothetical protein [uncultured Nostoc sp.]|uniref:hypothetical protein n=1 Tax=uncultured Nostoc sp. TaxID=340711 RepID=UPI0035CB245B